MGTLAVAAPLGSIEFLVTERTLPALTAFTVKFAPGAPIDSLPEELLAKIEKKVMQSTAEKGGGGGGEEIERSSVSGLLSARALMLEACGDIGCDVTISIEGTSVVATVVPVDNAAAASTKAVSGLEGSAIGGQGPGIEPFKRQSRKQSQEVRSAGLNIMMPEDSAISPGASSMANIGKGNLEQMGSAGSVDIEPWGSIRHGEERFASGRSATQQKTGSTNGITDSLAAFLTGRYAVFQAEAGRRVGIAPGEAWRVALEAAAASGARYVFLGDQPANVTGRRLAQGIWTSSAPVLLSALPAAAVAAIMASHLMQNTGPSSIAAPIAAALVPLVAAAWPIASPLIEVARFSKMSAPEIEDAVRVTEPVQLADDSPAPLLALFGEDALLKWPGAMPPIIHERDEYMTRAVAAVVDGAPEGLTPAFVRSVGSDGETTFRYAMPKGGNPEICPVGEGDGRFEIGSSMGDAAVERVVAVVGTAHLNGIITAWQQRVGKSGADVGVNDPVEKNDGSGNGSDLSR